MKLYSFRFLCRICRKIYAGGSTVQLDGEYETWYKGFLCYKCSRQQTLEVFYNE